MINEGRHDRLVGMLTRECIEAIRKGQDRHVTTFNEWGESVKFTFNFETTDEYTGVLDGGYFLPREWKEKGGKSEIVISCTIGLQEDETVDSYLSTVQYLLRNTIRHELEHHSQIHDKSRVQIDRELVRKLPEDAEVEYLMLPHEIAAFSVGIYAEAKTRKLSFSYIAREVADRYQANALEKGAKFSNLDKERVILAWENYAKKHTPKAKILEPEYFEESSRFMSYDQFVLNESATMKPIWKVEKMHGLESIGSTKIERKYVDRFTKKIEAANPQSSNPVQIALSALKPVTIEDREGPLHPNRCFLSSLEYMKDDEDNVKSVVGILKKKGSNVAWVHAFNKEGERYFDKSMKPEEFSQYEHYPITTVMGREEADVAEAAWILANSLQKAAEEYGK